MLVRHGREESPSSFEDESLQEGGGVTHAATDSTVGQSIPSVQAVGRMKPLSDPNHQTEPKTTTAYRQQSYQHLVANRHGSEYKPNQWSMPRYNGSTTHWLNRNGRRASACGVDTWSGGVR